jgi:hypothetical protein
MRNPSREGSADDVNPYVALAAWATVKTAQAATKDNMDETLFVMSLLPDRAAELLITKIAERDPELADMLREKHKCQS